MPVSVEVDQQKRRHRLDCEERIGPSVTGVPQQIDLQKTEQQKIQHTVPDKYQRRRKIGQRIENPGKHDQCSHPL